MTPDGRQRLEAVIAKWREKAQKARDAKDRRNDPYDDIGYEYQIRATAWESCADELEPLLALLLTEATKATKGFSDENHTRLSVLTSCGSPDGTAEVDQVESQLHLARQERDEAIAETARTVEQLARILNAEREMSQRTSATLAALHNEGYVPTRV